MRMPSGVGDALVQQPGVQLVVALDPHPRGEEPLPHQTDLVLDLTLLPARRRRAGDGVDQIVAAHLEEPAIIGPLATDEDRVHRSLHIVVNAARAGALEEREPLVVRVEHHLLRLARIGTGEQHPAVAQTQMRHLHRHRRAADQNDLVAPVELVCLAGREAQRHERVRRRRRPLAAPRPGIAPHRIVATHVAQALQRLEYPDQRQSLPARLRLVGRQQLVQLLPPLTPDAASAAARARIGSPSPWTGSPCARSSARPATPGRSP